MRGASGLRKQLLVDNYGNRPNNTSDFDKI